MDDEYAKLSLLAGIFARGADAHLGRPHFITILHSECWTLTYEKLATWKAEAIAMGVPAQKLEPSKTTLRSMNYMIKLGKRLQEKSDAAFFGDHVK